MGENSKAEAIASKFWMLGLLNGLLAVVFTIPIVVPSLCIATPPGEFGCVASMETTWPGTWLLVAFFTWVSVGVLGAFAWSMVFSKKAADGAEGNTALLWLTIILFEVGVLGATAMMAAIGYVGGNVVAHGGSPIASSTAIAENIIPPFSSDPTSVLNDMPPVVEGALIGVAILANLLGFLGLFTTKKRA